MATKQELETAIDNRFTLMDNTEEKKNDNNLASYANL